METQYAVAANAGAGPAPFFYYNPDPNAPHGQHGYFSTHLSEAQPVPHQHPASYPGQFHQRHQLQQQEQQFHQSPRAQGEPQIAGHEEANCTGQAAATKLVPNDIYSLSPTASPRPLHVKPSILLQQQESSAFLSLDTSCLASDLHGFPTTPPLSTDGSTISSPPSSCDMIRTPVNGGLLRCESIEGVKEGCEGDVEAEILANCDLARSNSPPLTPVFIRAPSAAGHKGHDNHVTVASTSASSPSLSPSPSPVLTSFTSRASQQPSISPQPSGSDVCDPRQLTVESLLSPSSSSSAHADFPPLPPLSPNRENDTDTDHDHDHDHTSSNAHHPDSNDDPCIAPGRADHTLNGLPSFDTLSDFESEDEDIIDLAPTDNAFYLGDKRRRIEPYLPEDDDDLVSEQSFEDFENDDLFARSALPLPESDEADETPAPTMKPKKRSSRNSIAKRSSMSESDSEALHSAIRTAAHDNVNSRGGNTHADSSTSQGQQQQQQSGGSSQSGSSTGAQPTNSSDAGRPPSAPVSRRGRKQSLTDDPSKTFVCTLCSRRFRRQEHLKRHYRSLHTEDKPFECADCGKKFSRSDNLAQHARIHGTASTTLTAATSDGHEPQEIHSEATEATSAPTLFEEQTETERLTDVLLDLARDAVNKETTSESSSDSGSADRSTTEEESPTPLPDRKPPLKKRKRETA